MDFKLVQSTIEDHAFISDLRMNVLAEDFKRHHLPDERVLSHFNENFNPNTTYLIQIHEEPVGCIGIRPEGDEILLQNFYLAPAYQGKGIGRAVFQFVLNAHEDKRVITLKIFKGSRAKKLYETFGFSVVDGNERVETMCLYNKVDSR